jgi:hypothetical protein
MTAAACPFGDIYHCGSQPCPYPNGVTLSAPLTVTAADVPNLLVTLCRNGVCVNTQPVLPDGGSSFQCDSYGPLSVSCQLIAGSSAGVYNLTLLFTGPAQDFSDGDVYSVTVGKPGAAPLCSVPTTSANYMASMPNGDGCDPICRTATLSCL